MKNFSNKISSFAVSFLLGAIIVAFVLTGFQGFNSNTGEVATVDGTPIMAKEFNQAVNQRIQQFSQFNKGKSLTQKQIRDYRIKESVLDQLINQKHFLNFATALEFAAGKEAVKNEIKDLPYFQTGGKFDVNKYKLLLSSNRITPTEFESQIVDQVKSQKLGQLIEAMKDSRAKIKFQNKLENTKAKINYALVNKNEMRQNLKVSKDEISTFVNDEKNKSLLESLYKTYEAQNSMKKEKVKSLEAMKSQLAKEHIQRTKTKELTAFNSNLKNDLENSFKTNQFSTINKLSKQWKFEFIKDFDLAMSASAIKSVNLEGSSLELFKNKDTNSVVVKETDTHFVIFQAKSFSEPKEVTGEDLKKLIESNERMMASQVNSAIIQAQKKNAKVTTASNLFL